MSQEKLKAQEQDARQLAKIKNSNNIELPINAIWQWYLWMKLKGETEGSNISPIETELYYFVNEKLISLGIVKLAECRKDEK